MRVFLVISSDISFSEPVIHFQCINQLLLGALREIRLTAPNDLIKPAAAWCIFGNRVPLTNIHAVK